MVVRRRPRRAQTTPPHRTNVRRVATLLARGGYLATRACAYVCAARDGCGGAGLCVRACRMCGRVCKYGRWTPAPRPTTHIVEQSTGADAIQRHPTHYATRTHRRGACSRNLPPPDHPRTHTHTHHQSTPRMCTLVLGARSTFRTWRRARACCASIGMALAPCHVLPGGRG